MKPREWKVGVRTLEYYKDHSEMFEAEWKQVLAENERLKDAASFAVTAMNHALHLKYCGEGSTKGMIEDAVKKLSEFVRDPAPE